MHPALFHYTSHGPFWQGDAAARGGRRLYNRKDTPAERVTRTSVTSRQTKLFSESCVQLDASRFKSNGSQAHGDHEKMCKLGMKAGPQSAM